MYQYQYIPLSSGYQNWSPESRLFVVELRPGSLVALFWFGLLPAEVLTSALSTTFSSALPLSYQPSETCHSLVSRSGAHRVLSYGLLRCFLTLETPAVLHLVKACKALMWFPVTRIPMPPDVNDWRLEFPGWISLEFPPQSPAFRGLLPFTVGGGAPHIAGLPGSFHFLALPVGKSCQWVKTHLVSRLLDILICYLAIKFTKISLSLSFLLFCHWAVRAEKSQLPNSLNNIFNHLFPFSEFHKNVSHM